MKLHSFNVTCSPCLFDICGNVHIDLRISCYPKLCDTLPSLRKAVEGEIQMIFGEAPEDGDEV